MPPPPRRAPAATGGSHGRSYQQQQQQQLPQRSSSAYEQLLAEGLQQQPAALDRILARPQPGGSRRRRPAAQADESSAGHALAHMEVPSFGAPAARQQQQGQQQQGAREVRSSSRAKRRSFDFPSWQQRSAPAGHPTSLPPQQQQQQQQGREQPWQLEEDQEEDLRRASNGSDMGTGTWRPPAATTSPLSAVAPSPLTAALRSQPLQPSWQQQQEPQQSREDMHEQLLHNTLQQLGQRRGTHSGGWPRASSPGLQQHDRHGGAVQPSDADNVLLEPQRTQTPPAGGRRGQQQHRQSLADVGTSPAAAALPMLLAERRSSFALPVQSRSPSPASKARYDRWGPAVVALALALVLVLVLVHQ